MRAALLLLLVVTACAKKAGEPAATGTGTVGGGQQEEAAHAPPPPPPPPADTVAAPKGSGSAIDSARSSGVLGPTDQQAFAIKSSVTIKRASTSQLDTAAKTNLDAVKTCYDKALEFKDTLTGELTLSIKAGKATVAKSTLGNAELEKCVVEALAKLPATAKGTLLLAFARQ